MQLLRSNRNSSRCKRAGRSSGFSLIEVGVSVVLIVLVATTALASLRTGLRTLGGTEQSARALDAISQFREYTYMHSVAEMDALNGTTTDPVLSDGTGMPDSDSLSLSISVQAVDDDDPESDVDPEDSSTRLVTVTAYSHGRKLQGATWLVTDY